jgi:transposase InsO family protein
MSKDPKLPKFSGLESDIPIDKWLRMFDFIVLKAADDVERIGKFMSYLDGTALEYYADRILPDISSISYIEAKTRLTTRFSFDLIAPILTATDRKHLREESVRVYFDQKLPLLEKTGMSLPNQIASLTSGLSEEYQRVLLAAMVTTTQQWLLVATNCEANLQLLSHSSLKTAKPSTSWNSHQTSQSKAQSTPTKSHNVAHCQIRHCDACLDHYRSKPSQSSRLSSTPSSSNTPSPSTEAPTNCRYCQALGISAKHWHKFCPNRKKNPTKPATPAANNLSALCLYDCITEFVRINVNADGHPLKAVVDTGSTLNMMSLDVAQELELVIDANGQTTFHMAVGSCTTVGTVQTQITFSEVSQPQTIQVVRDFQYVLLLGRPFTKAFPLNIDTKTNTATLIPESPIVLSTVNAPTGTAPTPKPRMSLRRDRAVTPGGDRSSTEPRPKSSSKQLLKSGQEELNQILDEYKDVFAFGNQIGQYNLEPFRILLKHDRPIAQPPRRQSAANEAEIDSQIADLLANGYIRESKSPYSAPITLATKQDGSKRLCIDYRRMNQETVDDKEPIPHIKDCIDNFANSSVFSQLDIKWCYWHFPVHTEDIPKTAFSTTKGHYEWLRMPFGLKNAPSHCIRQMRRILKGITGCSSYFDDIAAHGKHFSEHNKSLRLILDRLRQHNIKLSKAKCRFGVTEIQFLGHLVSNGTVRPQAAKVEAIHNYPRPLNLKDVQRFNGLASYLRQYIRDFAKIAAPITSLLKESKPFEWGEDQERAFNAIKDALISEPVLAIFDPECTETLHLHTDASDVGVGAILFQKGHPIGYFSKKFSDVQTRYANTDHEMLAVVLAVEHFQIYLEGTKFILYTDHMALKWMCNMKNSKKRLYRWAVDLSRFNFDVVHRPGTKMAHVDALSRAFVDIVDNSEELFADINPSHYALTTIGQPKHDGSVCIDQLKQWQTSAGLTSDTKPQRDSAVMSGIHPRNRTFTDNGLVKVSVRGNKKSVIPKANVEQLLKICHDNLNHPGIKTSLKLIKRYYFWQTMEKDIKAYVRSCHACQLVKPANHTPYGPLLPIPTPARPGELLAMDTIIVGSAARDTKAKNIQVVIDQHSRHVWAKPTPTNSAQAAIGLLEQIFETIPPPKKLLTDNGTNFTSKAFRDFLRRHRVEHIFTTAYHPQANGLNERVNGTIKRGLQLELMDHPRRKWSTLVKPVVDRYNARVHSVTRFSPIQLQFGKDLPESYTSVDAARSEAVVNSDRFKAQIKTQYDARHPTIQLNPGDLVKKRVPSNHPDLDKFTPTYDGPFRVISQESPVNFKIQATSGSLRILDTHVYQLEPYHLRSVPFIAGENVVPNSSVRTINN